MEFIVLVCAHCLLPCCWHHWEVLFTRPPQVFKHIHKISWSLLQAGVSVLAGSPCQMLQSLNRLGSPTLDCILGCICLLVLGSPWADTALQACLSSAEWSGMIFILTCWPHIFLMQHKMLLAFPATRVHCWFMLLLGVHEDPRCYSAKSLSSS